MFPVKIRSCAVERGEPARGLCDRAHRIQIIDFRENTNFNSEYSAN